MITIVNKHYHKSTPKDYYCGRGSPLGNPYSHMEGTKALYKVATRKEAIEKYLPWFEKERMNNPVVYGYLNHMFQIALDGGDMNLVCFCYPQDCHCRHIKEYLEQKLLNIKSDELNEIKS
jgi:hypothetical protein